MSATLSNITIGLSSATLDGLSSAGPTGIGGPIGPTGPIGYTGYTGAIGATGAIGYTGMTGPIGYTGYTGAIGYTGAVGYTGMTGPIGYTGYTGAIGYTGAMGATGASVNTSGLTSRYVPYYSGGTTLTNSLLYQIDTTDMGIGFTTLPSLPYTGSTNLYVNGSLYSQSIYSQAAQFGQNTATGQNPANQIVFAGSGGTLTCQVYSHTGSSAYADATWNYSNTTASPLSANTAQVQLIAGSLALTLANGMSVNTISTLTLAPLSGSTISTLANIAQPSTNDVSLSGGTLAVNLQPITTSILQTSGLSSQAAAAGVISGSYTLTPSPTTAAFADCYSLTQTFLTPGKYGFSFAGFSASALGVSLTIYQANTGNTARVAISATYAVVTGTFTGLFTPNPSGYTGQVFLEFSGTASKTVSWTSFTYTQGAVTITGNTTQTGSETVSGTLAVSGATTLSTTTTNGVLTANSGVSVVNSNIAMSSSLADMYVGMNNTGLGGQYYQVGSGSNGSVGAGAGGAGSFYIYNAGLSKTPFLITNSEIVSPALGSYGQFRAISGNFGVFLRNDGSDTYLLTTVSGNQYGTWSSLRPFHFNNTTGYTTMENGVSIMGGLTITGTTSMAAAQNANNSAQVYTSSGGTVTVAQCMMKQLYFSNSVAWGGGVNITSAFYRYSTTCPIRISGKYSGYWTFGSMGQVYLRFYSQSNGTYTYQYINTFTNNASNHVTVPLDQIFDSSLLPYLGWYDVFFASSSQFVTDSNDQLTLNVQFLPVAGF